MLSPGLPFGWLWVWNLVSAGSWRFGEEAAVQKYSAPPKPPSLAPWVFLPIWGQKKVEEI